MLEILPHIQSLLLSIKPIFTGLNSHFYWGYLLVSLAIFLYSRTLREFFGMFFDKQIISREGLIDFAFFLLFIAGVNSGVLLNIPMESLFARYLSSREASGWIHYDAAYAIPLGILLIVFQDLCAYVYHRAMHTRKWLFLFHGVHHSVPKMNIFSAYRYHPVDFFLFNISKTVFGFAIFIVAAQMIFIDLDVWDFVKLSVFVMAFKQINNVVRHSNVFMCYPRWLSYIIQSPAMHHWHHGTDYRQKLQNLAIVFSFWDWLFGTLYIPQPEDIKRIKYGQSAFDYKESVVDLMLRPLVYFVPVWKGTYKRKRIDGGPELAQTRFNDSAKISPQPALGDGHLRSDREARSPMELREL